jgi:hypothetical protein
LSWWDKTERKVEKFVVDIDVSEGTWGSMRGGNPVFDEESKQDNNKPTFERTNNR